MLKLSIKNILDKKVRFALTGFSIVLGVAFVVSSFVVKDSIGSTFDKLVTDIQGDIDLTVRTKLDFGQDQDRPPVPASTLDTVRATEGVAAAVPRLFSDKVAPVKADGEQVKTQGPPTIGINWADDDRLSQLFLVDGRKPAGPDEFALDITSAKDNGFVVGQRYTVVGPITKREMTLVGTAAFASKKNDTVGAVLTIFDTSTAQAFTCACKDYGDVAMRLDNPDDAASVIPRLEKNLANPNLEILTKSEAIKEGQDNFGQITNIIGTVLLVFAVIAVLVSAFIINNTFQIVLGQRVRELALLRALGASARQVGRSVVTEAFVLGAVATAVGTAAGVVLAIGLKALFKAIGFALPEGPILLRTPTLVSALVVGLGVTLLASISPARRARKVPPIAALRDDFQLGSGSLRNRVIAGLVVTALGAALLALGLFGGLDTAPLLASLGSGALTVFIGVNLLSPTIARPVSVALGRVPTALALFVLGAALALVALVALVGGVVSVVTGSPGGIALVLVVAPLLGVLALLTMRTALAPFDKTGQLGRENAARNPRRTSSTAAALMIGLALFSMTAVVTASIKSTVSNTLRNSVRADFIIESGAQQGPQSGIPVAFAEDLRKLPELSSVLGYTFSDRAISVDGAVKGAMATDLTQLEDHLDPKILSGSARTAGPDAILVQKDAAAGLGLSVGDKVEVKFVDRRTETLTVAAIFQDTSTTGANWLLQEAMWRAHNPSSTTDQIVTARVQPGTSLDQARAAIEAVGKNYSETKVQDKAQFNKSRQQILDGILAIVGGFLALALLIAGLGIANTLALSVFERTRELGLVRAVGMTRSQMRRMIRWEAVIVATFGAVLGALLGVIFGFAATAAIPKALVSTTTVPVLQILSTVVLAWFIGLIAAAIPAWRAGKLDVLSAISHE